MAEEQERQERAEQYEPPRVEDVPPEDGRPTVTAAGVQDTASDGGPEWRPVARSRDSEPGGPGEAP